MTRTIDEFLVAASAPLDAWHASGTLDEAERIRARFPELAESSVHAAAVLGNAAIVGTHLAQQPALATTPGGPHGWDPLTYLCFSRYLRLDPVRSRGFVDAAAALLDAGADPNTGWQSDDHQPAPTFESAIYGAAGVAHNAPLTALLLARGADPNDDETPYHAAEGYDNGAMHALVESGRLSADSLATMLLRKCDWHDGKGIKYLLEHGTDPNASTRWRNSTLEHALHRDNALPLVALLLDYGADPLLGDTIAVAARRGRRDVLELLRERGVAINLAGVDQLVAACALGDAVAIATHRAHLPDLLAQGAARLTEFAACGNAQGVAHLLDLGVPVDDHYAGDGYWDIAPDSTALHAAAWRAQHDVVQLLLRRGAAVDARDGKGRTALMLAIKACVDSHWADERQPDTVRHLLAAGATVDGVPWPSGYADADALLAPHCRSG